jgi:flagellar capping protein FliD
LADLVREPDFNGSEKTASKIMGRIQSSVGLATGIDIQGTVDQLMKLEAEPQDALKARQAALNTQASAIGDLLAQTLAVQVTIKRLAKPTFFSTALSVNADRSDLLSAVTSTNATAATGSYSFRPIRMAQAQQSSSAGFASNTTALNVTGTLSLQKGGFVDVPRDLETLNGGGGVSKGKIRITDRSGATAVVDLTAVKTVGDVLTAINSNENINVRASVEGDKIRLTDLTGESVANLRVQEVSGGSTALDLGLLGINAASSSALGNDVFRLYDGMQLDQLRDGNGLNLRANGNDLRVQLRDGSSFDVDFKKVAHAAQQATGRANGTNGINADIQFTAVNSGANYDGVQVKFVSSGNVTQGNETATYDSNSKTLTIDIAAGQTTADNVIAAVAGTPAVAALFTASKASGSDGSGIVSVNDVAVLSGGAEATATNEASIGDLLNTINAVDPTRFKAKISSDGERLEIQDLTTGSHQFSVSSNSGGNLAEQLGLAGSTSGNTLSGKRLASGLQSALLSSLNGGQGPGTLGDLNITDRTGASATVHLAGLETLDQVVAAINASGVGVTASINGAHDGLQLRDNTGSTAHNLVVANGDANNAATKLKIAVDAGQASIDSGSLGKQFISDQTLLSSYNGGDGVRLGSFTITDGAGATGAVNLRLANAKTVGDVITAINDAGIGVKARVNDSGNGILLYDTTGSSTPFTVSDTSSGNAAKDLGIAGTSTQKTVDSVPKSAIDGAAVPKIDITATDSLTTIVEKINASKSGVKAALVKDPSGSTPYRISLTGASGEAGRFIVGDAGLPFNFKTTTEGRDSLVQVGTGESSTLVTSDSNVVEDAVPGLTLSLKGVSTTSVTVTVDRNFNTISSALQQFVDQYNKLQDKLAGYTAYDASSKKKGALFGTTEALRLGNEFGRLVTTRFSRTSNLQSLETLGISLNDQGKLSLDTSKLQTRYDADPDAVANFFTDTDKGFAAKADAMIETMVGKDNSMLVNRSAAMQKQFDDFQTRIDDWTAKLAKKRERLLTQFYNLESAVSKIQAGYNSVSTSLANVATLASQSTSTS